METVEACEAYLDGLGISLWADWEIQNTERRKLAARWLARQVEAVEAVRNEHDFPSQGGHVGPPKRWLDKEKRTPLVFPTIYDPESVNL